MLVLAIDSSSDRMKLGLADEKRIYGDYTGPSDRSHSEKIFPELDKLLQVSHISPQAIDSLAVARGPGSFTGLRIGMAVVLGLATAWKKQVLTADNPKLERLFFAKESEGLRVVIHCRGDQFYVSDEEGIKVKSLDEIIPELPARLFCGTGTEKLRSLLPPGLGQMFNYLSPHSYGGGELASIFARHGEELEILNPHELELTYLLKSQPEQRRDEVALSISVSAMAVVDLDDVLRIERESFSDPWQREHFIHDLDDRMVLTLVARSQGRCIGYTCCQKLEDYGYISNLAVDRAFYSKGVGRSLLDELCRQLKCVRIGAVYLDVRASNERAIRFYQKYGFRILTRRTGFYTTPPEDSFTMELEIG